MRDYKKEYKKFQSSDKSKKDRAARNRSRRKLEKAGKVSKGDGMDVHHPNGPRKKFVKVIRKSTNRGMENEGGRKRIPKKPR